MWESEGVSQTLNDFSDNSDALAARYGIDTSDQDIADLYFDEVLRLRKSIANAIEHCEALDSNKRDNLAFELSITDVEGPNPAEPFITIFNRFRWLVISSNPTAVSENRSEIDDIDREFRYLIDCARASALD